MIYELKEGELECIRPLFERLRYNLVIDSVIDGNTPAWVYADDADEPRTAWIWNRQDAILLAGYGDNDLMNEALGDLFAEKVIPDAVRRHIPDISLHYSPRSWQGETEVVLRGAHPVQAVRRFYTFHRPMVDWQAQLPPGYRMEPLDEALLSDASLQHMRHVVGWVKSFWRSVPDFRNRGFATLVAAACVERCAKNHWIPHWHCWEDNLPSIAVAEKVGFGHSTNYEVFGFRVEP